MRETLWDQIEQRRARHHVLQHPFYVRWSRGELTRDELAVYAGQYRHAVQALADLSRDAAAAADGRRNGLDAHAREEAAHVALWEGFGRAAGADPGAEPTPQTRECVAAWRSARTLPEMLVAMYAIESGQPEIAAVKRDGLIARYGYERGPATEYFDVHEQLDVAHAAHCRELIEQVAEPDQARALAGVAERVFVGNWRLLDGVEELSGRAEQRLAPV